MFLGIANAISGIKSGGLSFIKDNLKLYLDFKSNKSDTLKFPSEGSTEFNGSSDYIETSDSVDFDFGTGDFSISFWFNVDDIDWNWAVSRTNSANSDDVFRAGINNSGKIIFRDRAGGVDVAGSTTISINTWYHFFAVRNSGTLKVYLNGSEDGSASSSGNLDSDKGFIIGRWQGNGDYWNGQLTNVAVWSRALESEEVQSIMNKSYNQLKGVEKTSLVMWQSLDSETASDRTPIEQNAKTETAPQEAENKIVLNSHGATTYTQILNESDRTFASQGNWVQGSGTFEFGNTDVYSEGALKISSAGWVYLATNGSGFDTALVSGNIYKIQFTWTVVDTSHAQNFWFGIDSSFGNYGLWRRYQFNTDQLPESEQVVTIYHQHDGGNYFYFRNTASSSCEFHIKNISCELIGNNVGISNATTTTSVYGGNAPILPRAVDVAKEGQADAIGNGSLTTSSGGYADLGNDSLIQFGGSFSVSCWFKTTDTTTTNEMVIAKADDGVSAGWLIRLNSSRKLDFSYLHNASGGSGVVISDTGSAVNDGEWYHVAFVHESGVGNRAYKNGILIGSNSTGTDLGSHTPNLHVGNQDYVTPRALDGSFAQVGLWQGALTQAQIQSLIESTSYSKIPADVKSTLGSEVVSGSDWTPDSGITVSNGSLLFDTSTQFNKAIDTTAVSGKLYKTVFTISNYVSGSVKIRIGAFGEERSGNGTYTEYIKSTTANVEFYAYTDGSNNFTIENISVKEVINDIVAYYSLDGDNSIPALSFDGTDDTIQTSAHDTLVDTTYTFWAKSDVTGANGGLFGHGGVTKSSFHFNYFGATGGARFFLGGNYFKKWDIDEQDDGQWHHYAIIADADSIADTKLYVDGVEKTASTTSSSGNPEAFTQSLTIGSDAINGNEWEGYIAQFAVYSDLKDADFIKAQYDKAIDADFSSDTNLVGYWKMNNGTTVNDLSGNGNNGTVSGATLIQNAVALDSTDNNNDGSLN